MPCTRFTRIPDARGPSCGIHSALFVPSSGWRPVRRVMCGESPNALTEQAETATGAVPFDEVVVTAQRREQKLQDVGIAVTPLGEETLQNLNITTATDIVRAVPSLKMNAYSTAQVVFNIRGVSQNDYGDQQEPPVAVYQDDSY